MNDYTFELINKGAPTDYMVVNSRLFVDNVLSYKIRIFLN